MSAKPEADPQLGRTLGGQYRIEALLGAGGMGRVYRGRQLSVNRPVAIKVIAGQAPYPPEWVWRFRREAEATASLSHPNSVRLFDFGVTESDELFMVMELLEGCDLARQLQAHGPLPLVAALAIARQVLLALCEAHELGITHRDIKPDNIFLASVRGADVVAKVMDFGIAGIAQAQRKSRLTGAGMIIGTPMYMSPEQAQGLRVNGKSDIYSLGVVLFEMLTGRPVFESHTAVTLLLAHVARAPMRLEEAGVQLREHASLQALLDRLLAKDPSERPSAAEALETVTALSTRLGIAGATGSMRALDLDAAAIPSAKARRGKASQPGPRAQSSTPPSAARPQHAAEDGDGSPRPAPPGMALAEESDHARRGSNADSAHAEREPSPALADESQRAQKAAASSPAPRTPPPAADDGSHRARQEPSAALAEESPRAQNAGWSRGPRTPPPAADDDESYRARR
ncbi:MAG TPA: protein kinase, partial [Polyangiales bacterium]|nr:protein kinase [Polyangiales bacterium]